tara:strand:+ start:4329 stop:5633 length:1305 start_codon:yes stop_codon:yes gene_type:complete
MKEYKNTITDSHGHENTMLFERVTGSRLYGTNYELGEHPFWDDYESDWDFRGVYVVDPEIKIMMPPFNKYDPHITIEGIDSENYELEKFMFESMRNNPNYMDLLFANNNSLIGINDSARILLDNKDLFLSNKIAKSFNGFAQSQMSRIKGHKVWLTKFPEIYQVQELITEAYMNNDISREDIAFNFSGKLRDQIVKDSNFYKPKFVNISFKEMLKKYFSDVDYDIYKYMKPYALDYITLYDFLGNKIQKNESNISFLENEATFKKKNESLYFIYGNGKGVFLDSRAIHTNLPVKANEKNKVEMIMTIDYNNFKSKKDYINSLWEWKVKRNGRRADLERRFGYDVKHAMHTYRLLDGAIDTFENGTYTPELSEKRLEEAFDILSGKYTYEHVVKEAETKTQTLLGFAKKGIFKEEPDSKLLNEIYLEVVRANSKS